MAGYAMNNSGSGFAFFGNSNLPNAQPLAGKL